MEMQGIMIYCTVADASTVKNKSVYVKMYVWRVFKQVIAMTCGRLMNKPTNFI